MDKCGAHTIDGGRVGCKRCNASWTAGAPFPVGCCDPIAPKRQPSDNLREAAALFEERNAIYGSNYQRQGAALLAIFPEGGIPAITTVAEANRLHVFVACVTKLMRYAYNFKDGHLDSARDLQVYAAMLEEFTDATL